MDSKTTAKIQAVASLVVPVAGLADLYGFHPLTGNTKKYAMTAGFLYLAWMGLGTVKYIFATEERPAS